MSMTQGRYAIHAGRMREPDNRMREPSNHRENKSQLTPPHNNTRRWHPLLKNRERNHKQRLDLVE